MHIVPRKHLEKILKNWFLDIGSKQLIWWNISSRFSWISEAFASEIRENLEEMFLHIVMYVASSKLQSHKTISKCLGNWYKFTVYFYLQYFSLFYDSYRASNYLKCLKEDIFSSIFFYACKVWIDVCFLDSNSYEYCSLCRKSAFTHYKRRLFQCEETILGDIFLSLRSKKTS